MLKDQTDLLRAFNTARVRYPLIGGYALGRYTDPRPEDFQTVYESFQIGAPPYAIDIISAISGLSFEEAWADSIQSVTSEGIPDRYLSSGHFIRNKTAPGGLQDLADAAAIQASRKANGDD